MVSLKLSSEIKTNSSEIVHQAVACGCGVGFLSTWEIRDDLFARKLVPILPQYREAPGRGYLRRLSGQALHSGTLACIRGIP